MDWLKLEVQAKRISHWIAIIGLLCLVALAIATVADVLMRWLFNSPIHGVHDLYKLVIAVVVGSFFPLALTERHHIAIRFLGSAVGGRVNHWLNNFANLALLIFLIVMAWQLVTYVFELYETGETTWILQWSVAPWWGVATACIILSIPIQFLVTITSMMYPNNTSGHGHAVPDDKDN